MQPQPGEHLWPTVATTRERIYVADGTGPVVGIDRAIEANESGAVFVLGAQGSNPTGRVRLMLPLGQTRLRYRFEHGGPAGFTALVTVYDEQPESASSGLSADRILNGGPQTDIQSLTPGSSIELEFDHDPSGSGLWRVVSTGLSEWLEAQG